MKRFLLLSLAVAGSTLLGACASMQPTPEVHAPSVAPVKHAVVTAEKHVSNARRVAAHLEKECPRSKKEIAWLNSELKQANQALFDASKKADILQKQNLEVAKQANKIAGERDKAIAKERVTAARYHHVKFVGSMMAGILALLLFFTVAKFVWLLPFPYDLLVVVGVPGIVTLLFNLLL